MTSSTTAAAPRRSLPRLPGIEKASAVYLLVFILVLFGLWIPDTFLSSATFKIVMADQVVTGFVALAVLIPLCAGAFDLSIGSNLALSLVILSWLEGHTGLPAFASAAVAVAACSLVGLVSGLLVVRLRVNSFIATLGMGQAISAATLYISGNKQIVGVFSDSFEKLGRTDIAGIPIIVFYLAVLAFVIWYVLEHTPLGRHLFATGANPEAARLSGVSTDRMVCGSLVASGFVAGLAGVVFAAKVGSFSNSFGPPLLFPAFAAVFFGATQFKRRANVWGTVLAVYTLAFGVKGLQLAFNSGVYWITPLFNGLALLLAVSLASRRGIVKLRRPAADETIVLTDPPPGHPPAGAVEAPAAVPAVR